jgi:hypothetical protein
MLVTLILSRLKLRPNNLINIVLHKQINTMFPVVSRAMFSRQKNMAIIVRGYKNIVIEPPESLKVLPEDKTRTCETGPASLRTIRQVTESVKLKEQNKTLTTRDVSLPRDLKDGTQPDVLVVDSISGVPPRLKERTVRIFRPCRTAMQSGTEQTHSWRLEFNAEEKWENPVMGWTSS